ncbi:adenylate/guanylate cyclase domain-containing protein [Mucilaginibacter ginkgonis]|uniref:Adenylate/guanylate cyclase domain-containing protein n=1 Tax=Mucilaginibacter ginkgonis TaxID=2682091 RepID=A0A6I4I015_9SPHI|nr:adenylate/guanylate cyclase domain-containing protein [Mucilaginibacter ginkgonis]QQL49926.1 adenylate/guanylate cyclase domain-containing protein [Mucilaginibacter ginkgonis]
MKKLSLIFLLLFVTRLTIAATKSDSVLQIKQIPEFGLGLLQWKQISADKPEYAAPTYNDSQWKLINPYLPLSMLPPGILNHVGWIRFKFRLSPQLTHSTALYIYNPASAIEIYLNGKLIERRGIINLNDNSGQSVFDVRPLGIPVTGDSVQTLAIRYARDKFFNNFNETGYQGIAAVVICTLPEINNRIYSNILHLSYIDGICIGILTLLTIFHFLLFYFDRSDFANIHFAGLTLCYLASYIVNGTPFVTINSTGYLIIGVISNLAAIASYFQFKAVSYLFNLNYKKIGWLILVLNLLLAIVAIFSNTPAVYTSFLMLFTSFPSVFLVFKAALLKIRGAIIIGIGFLISFVSLFIYTTYLNVDGVRVNRFIYDISIAGITLGISLSISFCLSKTFAQKSRLLVFKLKEVEKLSQEKQDILTHQKAKLEIEVAERTIELNRSLTRSDNLLLNILPADVAEELKEKGSADARSFDEVSVLFTDFVNFTAIGEMLGPKQLVDELHQCFKAFDDIMVKHQMEKIKTIGDAYLAVSGLPNADLYHAKNAIKAGLEIISFVKQRRDLVGDKTFDVRVGVHSGPVVAGIVGVKKFAYDIWGDTVNTAARMEQNSVPGKINVSERTYDLVKDQFVFNYRGEIDAKNKGALKMYFAEREI